MTQRPELRALAERLGILSSYIDQSGRQEHHTRDATREALVAALGHDGSSEAAAAASLEALEQVERARLLDPVQVWREHAQREPRVRVRLPELGAGMGIALDVYHVWWDPDLACQVKRSGRERLLAFHICDWLVPTNDMLYDRGMMGDGVIDIPHIRGLVEDAGYSGFCEVEILSKSDWWRRPMPEVLATCIQRYRNVC